MTRLPGQGQRCDQPGCPLGLPAPTGSVPLRPTILAASSSLWPLTPSRRPRGAVLGCTPPAGACRVPAGAGVCHTVTSCTTASPVSRAPATRPDLTAWPGDPGHPGDLAAPHRLPPWPERFCVGYQAPMYIPPLPSPSLTSARAGCEPVGLPGPPSSLTRPRQLLPHSAPARRACPTRRSAALCLVRYSLRVRTVSCPPEPRPAHLY